MKNKNFILLGISFLTFLVHGQSLVTLVDSPSTKFRDDIILDQQGNLYCADYGGTNIYKRTPSGVVSIFATGFNTPNGLAFDSNNDLFVCDNIGNRIYKLDLFGNFLDTFYVSNPSGLIKEFDSDTMIFTNYGSAHSLNKLAPDGTVIQTHIGMGLNGPVGLEYDDSGQLYVANFTDRKIFKVLNNSLSYLATVPGPIPNGALGFLAFGNGYLWATSWHEHKIYGVSTTTTDSTFVLVGLNAGGSDGHISTATLTSPNGIYSNSTADTIYITEYNTGKLRMIRPDFANLTSDSHIDSGEIIFPNPAKAYQAIQIKSNLIFDQILITNYAGQSINNYMVDSKKKEIIFYSEGIYFIHLKAGDRIITRKIVIG